MDVQSSGSDSDDSKTHLAGVGVRPTNLQSKLMRKCLIESMRIRRGAPKRGHNAEMMIFPSRPRML